MPEIIHRFQNHVISPETEILIIGTFNPGMGEGPDFFYGRDRNFLWQLLPGCWGLASLKGQPLRLKLAFMKAKKIDFVDLINKVNVPAGQENNVKDTFIDNKVLEWKDVAALINRLPNLKAVYFTRKSFGSIPHIKMQIRGIKQNCSNRRIRFCLLPTPARFTNAAKQQAWIDTIINQTLCFQPLR